MKRILAMVGALSVTAALAGCTNQAASTAHADTATAKVGAKKGLAIGDAAPAWKELAGVDDKAHSLDELEKAEAVVVVFTCNHCPVAKAYEERLVALDKDYKEKGVAVVAINVNTGESDKLPAMKERAEEQGFEFAYLYDPSQAIGREFGATVTPHAFVLDKERKLAYKGAIDDSMDAAKAEQHYVRDVLDSLLAGKAPATAETNPAGCGIGYE